MLKFLNEQPRTTFKGLLLATNVGWANLEVHVTFNSVSMRNGSSDIIITVEVFEGTTKKKKKKTSQGIFLGPNLGRTNLKVHVNISIQSR